jgi:hypothetical protein
MDCFGLRPRNDESFLPSVAKQSMAKSLMLFLDRHGRQGGLAMMARIPDRSKLWLGDIIRIPLLSHRIGASGGRGAPPAPEWRASRTAQQRAVHELCKITKLRLLHRIVQPIVALPIRWKPNHLAPGVPPLGAPLSPGKAWRLRRSAILKKLFVSPTAMPRLMRTWLIAMRELRNRPFCANNLPNLAGFELSKLRLNIVADRELTIIRCNTD